MKYPLMINRQINIPYLLKIGEGKIAKIGKYLYDKEMTPIAVFWGEGMPQLIGRSFYAGLLKYKIEIAFEQTVSEIAVEKTQATAFTLPTVTAIIGVGGGKALDFAKYTAYLRKIPFISVPCSISNDGFCSPISSLTFGGRRLSVKSSIPFGVVVDLAIINDSPLIGIYSGIGDMFAKVSALWDWKQAFLRGSTGYNDFAAMLAHNSLDLLYSPEQRKVKSLRFQRILVTSLLYSGIAMEIAGTSRPASGSEHLISHALDEISASPQMHGLQVGVAGYLCARLQQNQSADLLAKVLSDTGFFDFVSQRPLLKAEFIEALRLAPLIKDDYFTVLSEPWAFEQAVRLIENDQILQRLIVD